MSLLGSYPVLATTDIVVIVMRDYEPDAYLTIKAITPDARLTVQSYLSIDALASPPAATANFVIPEFGQKTRINIPNSGVIHHQVTRILITNGRIALDVSSPSVFRAYIEQPISPPRIA